MTTDQVCATWAVRLPAAPASVPTARAFLRGRLGGLDEDVVDCAELCLSELATNGVMHARTELEIRIELLDSGVRIAVADLSPAMPRHVLHSERATTGRGLDMVRVLSDAWGVDIEEGRGKVVWCRLGTDRTDQTFDEDSLLAAWPDELDTPIPTTGGSAVLLNYPVRLGMRHAEHFDGLLRECLLVSTAAAGDGTSATGRLAELATTITERYAGVLSPPVARRTEALLRGEASIDLEYPLPPDASTVLVAWRAAITALDDYAAMNHLLILQTPSELMALRDWVTGELLAQAAGAQPTPWTGPAD